ncbi:ZIP family metal transporter [Pseudobacillus sp. 179-B 2D1 NHS]|uniref:ZIP family metal transporter n=1 Tax=Pseudobacillus sp. 179-B 2D1 NHS TaxID=3374292 RepID=UPI003879F808
MSTANYLLSCYIFLGTSFGALVALFLYKFSRIKVQHLYLLCGGVLVGLIMLELVPHSVTEFGLISIVLGTSLGILLCICLHNFFDQLPSFRYRSVVFLVTAITVHNIPTGLAIGSTLDNQLLSSSFVTAILLHQVPEGLAIMVSLLNSRRQQFNFSLFLSICLILSGFFLLFSIMGSFLDLTLKLNGLILGISIGFLSFTAVWEFIIATYKKVHFFASFFLLLLGIGVIYLFSHHI